MNAGLVMLAAYMPFSVLYFAIKGHEVWLESPWSGDSSTPADSSLLGRRGSLSAAPPVSTPGSPAPHRPRNTASLDGMPTPSDAGGRQQLGSVTSFMLNPSRQGSGMPAWPGARPLILPDHLSTSVPDSPAVQQRRGAANSQQYGHSKAKQNRGALYSVKLLLLRCVATVVAAAVGTVAYIVLLVALVLALLWAWVTRTVFSVYCIFFPCAADTPCCLKPTRTGDFWGVADIRVAFAAAQLSVTHSQQLARDSAGGGSVFSGKNGYDASCSVSVAQRPAWATSRRESSAAAAAPGVPSAAATARRVTYDTSLTGQLVGSGRVSGWDSSSPGSSAYSSSAGGAVPGAVTEEAPNRAEQQ